MAWQVGIPAIPAVVTMAVNALILAWITVMVGGDRVKRMIP